MRLGRERGRERGRGDKEERRRITERKRRRKEESYTVIRERAHPKPKGYSGELDGRWLMIGG